MNGKEGADSSPTETESLGIAVGEIIAKKFRVDRILGQGGMGVVVLATHLALDEKFALKLLRRELASERDVVERFSREAKACVKIKSEHVARVHDVGMCENGTPFMVMEYLTGADLGSAIAEGPLPVEEAVDYVIQACEALAQAHALGIVHRDIKPENLFLVSHAEGGWRSIKVLDFGISKAAMGSTARLLEEDAALLPDSPAGPDTRGPEQRGNPTRMAGTPLYMSPEQVQRLPSVDGRSDVWSLGVVLYELLTTRSAWRGDSVHEIASSILEAPSPKLELFRPNVPYGLSEVIERCLEKDPEKRYAGVAELAVALLPFAPRRARVPAERATQVARAAGLSSPDLRFPTSVFPPSLNALAVNPGIPPPPSLPAVSRDAPTMPDVSGLLDAEPAKKRTTRVIAPAAFAASLLVIAFFWIQARTREPAIAKGPPAVEAALTTHADEDLEILPAQGASQAAAAGATPEEPQVNTPSLGVAAPAKTSGALDAHHRRERHLAPTAVRGESDGGSTEPDLGY
jgi:serine/threonine protein kinase